MSRFNTTVFLTTQAESCKQPRLMRGNKRRGHASEPLRTAPVSLPCDSPAHALMDTATPAPCICACFHRVLIFCSCFAVSLLSTYYVPSSVLGSGDN